MILALVVAAYIVIADRNSESAKELLHVCTHIVTGGFTGLIGLLGGKALP